MSSNTVKPRTVGGNKVGATSPTSSPPPSPVGSSKQKDRKSDSNQNVKDRKDAAKATRTTENDSKNAFYMFVTYAMIAGACGALSGVVGKLSVTSQISLPIVFRIASFVSNGFFTAQMWRYYLKSLSLGPTPICQIINTATNFSVSALLGLLLFGEQVTLMWVAGAVLVVCGLGIIVTDPTAVASSNAAPTAEVKDKKEK